MKISKELPQFENGKTLLVVSGARSADFYSASRGEIKKTKSIGPPKPDLPEKREGFFISSTRRGMVLRSGSVYEKKKEKIEEKFMQEFEAEMKTAAKEKIESLYIFAPKHVAKRIEKSIPAHLRTTEKALFYGNYQHSHPFDILKEIKKKESPKVALMREEARKILQKTQKARRKTK